jgi:hypothetical protein
MTTDFAYDPVTAIDEAKATGETAALFAEIRQTLRIPLVTSIWRGLASMDDGLRLAWVAAKPIYESGEPERALTRSVAAVGLPGPEPLAPTALACVGLTESDLVAARVVVAAYNRSNGLNLMALAGLIAPSATGAATAPAVSAVESRSDWPPLPPLLPSEAIRADTWDIIRHVNAFGASVVDAGGSDALASFGALACASRAGLLRLRAAAITWTDRGGERPDGCARRGRRRAHGASASDFVGVVAPGARHDHRLCQKSQPSGAYGDDRPRPDRVAGPITCPRADTSPVRQHVGVSASATRCVTQIEVGKLTIGTKHRR